MVIPRKIPMAKRDSGDKLNITFIKRRAGLFHKASELSTLCDAQVAVLISSPNGRLHYSFAPTSVNAVLDAFLAGRKPERVAPAVTQEAHRLAEEISGLEGKLRRLKELGKAGGCPWEALRQYEDSVTSADELRTLYDTLCELKAKHASGLPVPVGLPDVAGNCYASAATGLSSYGFDLAGNSLITEEPTTPPLPPLPVDMTVVSFLPRFRI